MSGLNLEYPLYLHSNGPHSGSPAAVWYTECLVKVEVRHVGAVVSGTTETHLQETGKDITQTHRENKGISYKI